MECLLITSINIEYLAVFSQMIAYHDPELMAHLDSITFIPDVSIIFRSYEANQSIKSSENSNE